MNWCDRAQYLLDLCPVCSRPVSRMFLGHYYGPAGTCTWHLCLGAPGYIYPRGVDIPYTPPQTLNVVTTQHHSLAASLAASWLVLMRVWRGCPGGVCRACVACCFSLSLERWLVFRVALVVAAPVSWSSALFLWPACLWVAWA